MPPNLLVQVRLTGRSPGQLHEVRRIEVLRHRLLLRADENEGPVRRARRGGPAGSGPTRTPQRGT
ncbi:hypothetical protein ABZY19_04125 [Streptomyces sp. NPDC006475]|uniref:hypothetical protein n=1 Tax=Streptomyces sp. NPDC006475 TaxID=3155719 RepID=UPI0033BF20D4